MRGLFCLGHQPAQMRLRTIAKVVLLDGAIAEVEKPQTQAKFAVRSSLHHPMALKNHQKPVGRAFVQLERRRNLRQPKRRFALAEQVQNGEGPIQSLDFVGSLGSSVSHFDPPCR